MAHEDVVYTLKVEQMRDLQEDLDKHLDKLANCDISEAGDSTPVEANANVADIFCEMVEIKFYAEDCWLENLAGVRIPALRKYANYAARFGLSELAGIIRKHIALRKGQR
jgi:hypothetical protein